MTTQREVLPLVAPHAVVVRGNAAQSMSAGRVASTLCVGVSGIVLGMLFTNLTSHSARDLVNDVSTTVQPRLHAVNATVEMAAAQARIYALEQVVQETAHAAFRARAADDVKLSSQCGRTFSEIIRTGAKANASSELCSIPELVDGMLRGSGNVVDAAGYFQLPINCSVQYWHPRPACDYLERHQLVLVLIGDSLVRHVTSAVWSLLSGNLVHGHMRWWVKPPQERAGCTCNASYEDWADAPRGCRDSSIAHFNEKEDDFRVICPQWTRLRIIYDGAGSEAPSASLTQRLHQLHVDGQRAIVLLHQGNHLNMDTSRLENNYDAYIAVLKSAPAVLGRVFMTIHHQDDTRKRPTQRMQFVLPFNARVRELAREAGAVMLETVAFTAAARSFDGTHYSVEVNVPLGNMFLNYVRAIVEAAAPAT